MIRLNSFTRKAINCNTIFRTNIEERTKRNARRKSWGLNRKPYTRCMSQWSILFRLMGVSSGGRRLSPGHSCRTEPQCREPRAYWQPELKKTLPKDQEVRWDYGKLGSWIHFNYIDLTIPDMGASWWTSFGRSGHFHRQFHNEWRHLFWHIFPQPNASKRLCFKTSPIEEAERRWHLKTNCMISKAILSLISRSKTICLHHLEGLIQILVILTGHCCIRYLTSRWNNRVPHYCRLCENKDIEKIEHLTV